MPEAVSVTTLARAKKYPVKPRDVPENAVSVRVPQMCQMLGIGPTKANELIRSGAVDSVRLGKTRLVSVASIHALFSGKAA